MNGFNQLKELLLILLIILVKKILTHSHSRVSLEILSATFILMEII